MEITKLSNDDLFKYTKSTVGEERRVLARLIVALRENERRKLYLSYGYGSLFSFCTLELNFTEAEAYARIQAMRLSKDLPHIVDEISCGEVTLSIAAEAQPFFRREEKAGRELSVPVKKEIIESLKACTFREAEKKLQERFNSSPVKKKLTFYASPELVEKLEKLKGLLAHQNYDGDLAVLIELLADKALTAHEKALQPKPLRTSQVKARARQPRSATKRQVWIKAGSRCEFVDKVSGRRCNSRHALEVDHIQPFALGGGNEISNLRLLCAAHNQFRNESHFSHESGREEMVF